MGQDPEELRADIERQRDEMSDTIDAIGYKADVPARSKEAVTDRVDAVKAKVGLATSKANDATPSTGEMKDGAKQAAGVAKDNPLGLALGAVAVGFLAGMIIPTTAKENEAIGPMADKVKESVSGTASEALEHGKQIAAETADTAKDAAQTAVADIKDTAQSSAQEHGSDLKDSAQETAQSTASDVKDAAPST